MAELIGLDFETYGAEDLPTHGLDRYVSDKSFQPLIGRAVRRTYDQSFVRSTFDFVGNRSDSVALLRQELGDRMVVAHNAPFEQAVLSHLGIEVPSARFIDSAVVARAAGAGSRLEAAAPQLLGVDKLEEGRSLIKLFSKPGKYQEENGDRMFDPRAITDHPAEWALYGHYCMLDAELGLRIVEDYFEYLTDLEPLYQAVTMDMNRTGWCVDVPLVEEMQRRYRENQEQALFEFRQAHDAEDLNLNSLKQLKEWCEERGVKATSFDEKHVASLLGRIEKKLEQMPSNDPKYRGYCEVRELLVTKQILGGSSLKKLQVILNVARAEGDGTYRLRDQYLHCGAGQTLRTSGRSVQMQNLKRLGAEIDDVTELLEDDEAEWDNSQLAQNLRQCFTATEENGRLIVGDFASVESRGLAYLARETWKLDAYRRGQDMYKVLASSMFNVAYDDVTKTQRQAGKVGELSCGYNAGAGAVQAFAEGMGVTLTEAEAAVLVTDWRAANPKVVDFWTMLDDMLHDIVENRASIRTEYIADDLHVQLSRVITPTSLANQHPGAASVLVEVTKGRGLGASVILRRVFHGCYLRGRDVCYYKPSDRKTGDLWRGHFVNPKTKQLQWYKIYGGKLAGILTQSFCRELFMACLLQVHRWCAAHPNQLTLVGQFHDEIVVDWKPGPLSLAAAKHELGVIMSDPSFASSFPLTADIKDDYRYTK